MQITLAPSREIRLRTPRLVLRPTELSDAGRAFEIQSNWAVAKMLRMAQFPPDLADLRRWFSDHTREWFACEAYRFAIMRNQTLIGVVDITHSELGYWLDECAWGQGFATEAAGALVEFAFKDLGLNELRSGHATDNPASGRVLQKLGFHHVEDVRISSRSRGGDIIQSRYVLSARPVPC